MTDVPTAAVEALTNTSAGSHVVTIGNFDGVHRGHQLLLGRVVDHAKASESQSLVVTFEPHPTAVFRPGAPFERLTSPEEKLRLLRSAGIDGVAVVPFDLQFASLSPEEFLKLLTETIDPIAIFVGDGFRFGRGREGDGTTLREFAERHGFEANVVPRLHDEGGNVSSSSIRAAIHDGRVSDVARALGRPYRLRGIVEHGVARGRELGYPTANLRLPVWACVPMDGIYAGYAHVGASIAGARQAMIYIGKRPTFDNGERIVEVNILDFNGDLYAKDLEFEFAAFIRPDVAFQSIDALVEQIAADEADTRECLRHGQPEKDGVRQAT